MIKRRELNIVFWGVLVAFLSVSWLVLLIQSRLTVGYSALVLSLWAILRIIVLEDKIRTLQNGP